MVTRTERVAESKFSVSLLARPRITDGVFAGKRGEGGGERGERFGNSQDSSVAE
jgi:hypothetical protein